MNSRPQSETKDLRKWDEPHGRRSSGRERTRSAPTLYGIIIFKLLKGAIFVAFAIVAYTLSDNNLPDELHKAMQVLRVDPANKFFTHLAEKLGSVTEASVLWAAAGTLIYSLFSLVEGVGLIFRASWACWLAIGESAFFIPIEVYELARPGKFSWWLLLVLILNIIIVWYLFKNRNRIFRHHSHHHSTLDAEKGVRR
jgi:uncharacterized membrane protein (DUF2068 family)